MISDGCYSSYHHHPQPTFFFQNAFGLRWFAHQNHRGRLRGRGRAGHDKCHRGAALDRDLRGGQGQVGGHGGAFHPGESHEAAAWRNGWEKAVFFRENWGILEFNKRLGMEVWNKNAVWKHVFNGILGSKRWIDQRKTMIQVCQRLLGVNHQEWKVAQ